MLRAFVITLLLSASGWILAHDFWVDPGKYYVKAKHEIPVFLHIGHPKEYFPYSRNPNHIIRFQLLEGKRKKNITGLPGQNPAGNIKLEVPGTHVIVYQSNPSLATLQPHAFNDYLQEEGLGWVIEDRKKYKEDKALGREYFSRFCKAIVVVDNKIDDTCLKPIGLPMEIIPEKNPLLATKEVPIVVQLGGKPAANVMVEAISFKQPDLYYRVRTDKNGRAVVPVTKKGKWLFAGVHMERLPQPSPIQWRSYWAALTFEIR